MIQSKREKEPYTTYSLLLEDSFPLPFLAFSFQLQHCFTKTNQNPKPAIVL